MSLLLLAASAHAATFRHLPEAAELRDRSRAVVVGTVVEATTARAPWGLATTYTVAVERTLAGAPEDTVEVTLPGGRADGLTQVFSDVPLWSPGDAVLVFVPAEGERQSLAGVFTRDGERLFDPHERFRAVADVERAIAER